MAQHHISDDLLAAYAAGATDEATSALVAAHLTLCAQCRMASMELDALGGAALDTIDFDENETESNRDAHMDFDLDAFDETTSSADGTVSDTEQDEQYKGSLASIAPQSLVDYTLAHGGSAELDSLPWRAYAPGIQRAVLDTEGKNIIARFLRAKPGAKFPHHDHGSDEMTIVLQGAYRDHTATYGVGDVQRIGEQEQHRPVIVGDEVCIAFAISEKPPIPTGIIAKIVQRLIG